MPIERKDKEWLGAMEYDDEIKDIMSVVDDFTDIMTEAIKNQMEKIADNIETKSHIVTYKNLIKSLFSSAYYNSRIYFYDLDDDINRNRLANFLSRMPVVFRIKLFNIDENKDYDAFEIMFNLITPIVFKNFIFIGRPENVSEIIWYMKQKKINFIIKYDGNLKDLKNFRFYNNNIIIHVCNMNDDDNDLNCRNNHRTISVTVRNPIAILHPTEKGFVHNTPVFQTLEECHEYFSKNRHLLSLKK